MKRSSVIKRKSQLKRKKKLNRISPKQKARLAKYFPIQQDFLRQNPWCVVCIMLGKGKVPATEAHHVRGRNGSLLFDTRFFASTCWDCRMIPHLNPKWAREVGLLAPQHEWGVVPN